MMADINYQAIHADILKWFGKRTATRLCGKYTPGIESMDPMDPISMGSLFYPLMAGEYGSYNEILKSLEKDEKAQLLLAILLINGVDPLWRIKRYRTDLNNIANLFMESLSVFTLKAVYPDEDVESILLEAVKKTKGINHQLRSNSAAKLGEAMVHRVINGQWDDECHSYLEPIIDPAATAEAIKSVAEKFYAIQHGGADKVNNTVGRQKDNIINDFFYAMKTRLFQAWKLSGVSFHSIFTAFEIRFSLQLQIGKKKYSDRRVSELVRITRAMMLAGYPELYLTFGVSAEDFLGDHLIKEQQEKENHQVYQFDHLEYTYGTSAISRYSDDSYVKKVFACIVRKFPDIYSAKYCIYSGSRTNQWCSEIKDLTGISEILNLLKKEGIWHPLLSRKDFVAVANQESTKRIIKDFLEDGTKWRQIQAENVLSHGKIDMKPIIKELSLKKHFVNLAKIYIPSPGEYALIPQKYRKDFLREQLDI